MDCRRIGRLKTHDSRKGWAVPSRIQTLLLAGSREHCSLVDGGRMASEEMPVTLLKNV